MSEETTPTQAETTAPGAASNTGGDKEGGRGYGEGKVRRGRKRKVSYLTINKIDKVDYKEVNILRRFTNDRGKILSSKHSGNTAKQQRMISEAIRRAREMALMPFVVREISAERPPRHSRPYREDRGPRDAAPAPAPEAAAPEASSAE